MGGGRSIVRLCGWWREIHGEIMWVGGWKSIVKLGGWVGGNL